MALINTMYSDQEITEFNGVLHEFEILPIESKSIFEIAGYPHYENVCSNILAFYINPDEEHRLSFLFLNSLLNLWRSKIKSNNSLTSAISSNHGDIRIEREYTTDKNGRIDIVIHSDSQIIAIENKIFAAVTNDLDDYSNTLHKKAGKKNVVKIILSKKQETEQAGFVCITYDEYFSSVREQMGRCLSTSSQKWVLYLVDFMSAIDNLYGGSMEFTKIDEFLINNRERIEGLIKADNKLREKLNTQIRKLREIIGHPNTCEKQWIYNKNCLVHDFVLSGHQIAFDLYIRPNGWSLELFGRNDKSREYLDRLIKVEPLRNRFAQMSSAKRYTFQYQLSKDLERLKTELLNWFDQLARSEAALEKL